MLREGIAHEQDCVAMMLGASSILLTSIWFKSAHERYLFDIFLFLRMHHLEFGGPNGLRARIDTIPKFRPDIVGDLVCSVCLGQCSHLGFVPH